MANIFLHEITPEQFKELVLEAIRESSIDSSLVSKNSCSSNSEDSTKNEFLTRKQTAELLQISLPTLHEYTKKSLITSFRLGNKIRYKESDIKAALTERNFGRRKS